MDFGIYVHIQGPGGLLKDATRALDLAMQSKMQQAAFDVIDAIYISFQSSSKIRNNFRVRKCRVRRDHILKLITGGEVHYNCMIECDIDLPDADVIEAGSLAGMDSYLKRILIEVAPLVFEAFPIRNVELFVSAVEGAQAN